MASSQPSQNVELEAAKFLQKLIHDSKDEPAKLATKLFVILQHMRSSGKEHSMPYQVISRAMETVISQHNLDIEALMSSRLPPTGGGQGGDSGASSQYAGSSQAGGVGTDAKGPYIGNDPSKVDLFSSSRPPVGPGTSHDYYQGSGANRSNQSFDHESPSSLDTKSANSHSQERGQKSKDSKKGASKRRRGDSSLASESHVESSQQLDRRKGKLNNSPGGLSVKESENASFGIVSAGGQPEAPSAHVPTVQQGGSLLSTHESLSSRVSWNQSRAGLPLEKSQVPRFSCNSISSNVMTEMPAQQSTVSSLGSNFFGSFGKIPGGMPATSGSHVMGDTSFLQFGVSEPQKSGIGKSVASHSDKPMEIQSFPDNRVDDLHASVNSSTLSGQDGGNSTVFAEANYSIQGVRQNNSSDTVMARASAPRDLGKSSVSQNHLPHGMPFKEHQLKQLRAQCLVFLAFRNGLIPKKLHLEVALGSLLPKDGASPDGRKEMVDQKGKAQSSTELPAISDVSMAFGRPNNPKETDRVLPVAPSGGRLQDGTSLLNQDDQLKPIAQPPNFSAVADERKHLSAANSMERVKQGQETMESDLFVMTALQQPNFVGNVGILGSNNPTAFTGNGLIQVGRVDQASPSVTMKTQQELLPDRKDDGSSHFQSSGNIVFPEQEDDENSDSGDSLPSPRYTMSEKWITDVQRKKVFAQQKLILKQQKTKQRIAVRFEKLKEVVSLSEDLSAKTKSVIELKKLQLLELQHRLRSEFLGDFFKPITADMDRLKSYKKHKHGRRTRQLEKFEQKMKEERQKRIRERQKEFFAEIEVHKERVDDIFKIKKERWKGFNRYVKEFHKRKERIHREKIDRIQREKINLLKINDVEGYLRMVQDAKSDRVKQLLKETEKYLQKLGSKLRDAKVMTSRFENDMDETRTTALLEKNETSFENDDENDQAKHYLESNEKYYLMAHSIKESIAEQPTSLVGGKLREYQMNGLRWLVSLYNNHLNGILADEMGLGKTVQVISLICYLMETKNDRGPFLVVVPSSVLPGWESEINFWAPGIHKIVYSGPPEERRRLFKEQIVHQKFNVLLTTYEYLMNKHDRPKLSKVHWHYIIIDEGHRIKNASCKLNADLKHYQSSHRLLLTGTPLQNNLEELWALLNFLLPNIFNSSEDFSQWFNKPFEGNGDSSAEEALLSEEENLLIINRLHQVLRPFVLRRLKHKVENQLPEKIERLIRCEASAYQKLLMRRVEENLGSIGNPKARSVHNSVMELRNICNHPYLSQLHSDEVDNMVPRHFLPNIIRHCGKLEMLDRLLPKLKATDHRVLFFSTMTRLLDIMEEYLTSKQYRYLRLDGHTAGGDRGALIDQFNNSNSPYFIFLLSIRAGGVGVNLQAADTVIIFDTDWNPQVDLQAQARAHRIGQKRDVLVLRFETVKTVEEQVRASAEHKLGVANQSITAGFFDNNTSAEDRREYLEALLRECKKEEDAPVLDDDALNDLIARSESEIDIFESIDKRRRETETGIWKQLLKDQGLEISDAAPSLPSRLVTDDDLKAFYEVIKLYDVPKTVEASNVGMKRKGQYTDTQHYGRGKRAREVRSYEEQWTEEEFEKLCQSDSPGSPSLKEEDREWNLTKDSDCHAPLPAPAHLVEPPAHLVEPPAHVMEPPAPPRTEEITPPPKRGRGRPRRVAIDKPATAVVVSAPPAAGKTDGELLKGTELSSLNSQPRSSNVGGNDCLVPQLGAATTPGPQPVATSLHTFGTDVAAAAQPSAPMVSRGRGRKVHGEIQPPRRRGRKPGPVPAVGSMAVPNPNSVNQSMDIVSTMPAVVMGEPVSGAHAVQQLANMPIAVPTEGNSGATHHSEASSAIIAVSPSIESSASPSVVVENKESNQMTQSAGPPRRRGRKPFTVTPVVANISATQLLDKTQLQIQSRNPSQSKYTVMGSNQDNEGQKSRGISSEILAGQDKKSTDQSNDSLERQQVTMPTMHDVAVRSIGYSGNIQDSVDDVANAVKTDMSAESSSLQAKVTVLAGQEETGAGPGPGPVLTKSVVDPSTGSVSLDGAGKLVHEVPVVIAMASQPISGFFPVSLASQSSPAEAIQGKRQGRRASSGVEGPRRRGRRPGSASSKVEVSVGRDPKLDLPTPYKSRDASGSLTMSLRSRQETDPKLLANVVQESNSPGVVAQDLKRKEPGGTPTFGRLQTADVTGVARLMKEIFSETSSFKTKTGDSSRSDSRSTTHARALNKAPMEVPKSQSSEDKACPASVPTLVAGVTVDSSRQSGTTISIDFDDGPPGFGSCNKKDGMSKTPLVSSTIVKSGNDSVMAVDPSGSLSGDSKSSPVQDLLISKSSCEPSPKESFSLTPDAAGAVEGAGVETAGEFNPICHSSCDLGLARSSAVNKKDPATERQPSLKESEESPAAGVGILEETSIASERSVDDPLVDASAEEITAEYTGEDVVKSQAVLDNLVVGAAESQPSLEESVESPASGGTFKETSIASERSGDDPLVDVSVPATKDADMETVRSDLCPAEAITAEYTGEDVVRSQAVLDNLVVGAVETQPSLEETEESPAAGVGTFKETSIASERSGDDPLVDVSAPATKDADMETVRSDLCPAEVITAEYTGVEVVKSHAVLDNLVVGAAETQPSLEESVEFPAAGGTLKETSIASERSVDDPMVDVSAPATTVADVETVRSDSCPAEAMTAEYTGEDVVKSPGALDNLVVGTAAASRDESELPCAYSDDNSKSLPEPDISVTSKCTAADLADFCALEKQASGGIATSSGCSSLKEDNEMMKLHQGIHKGNAEHYGSTEDTDLSNSSSSLPQDITAISAGLQIIEEKVCPVETKLSDRSMTELADTQAGCGQTSPALEDSTAHFCSALENERVDGCQDGVEQNNAGPQVADRVITDVGGRTLVIQQDSLPLPSVVMEENKIVCLSNEGPAGGTSALEQPSEAEMTEDGRLSQPGAPPNHSSDDSIVPSSSLMLEQEDHKLQLDQGLCGTSDLAERNEGLEAKEIVGTDLSQGNSSLDNASESLPLPLSCLVTVENKGSADQSLVSEPEGLDDKDDTEIGLNDPSDNRMGLDEQKDQGLSEKGSMGGSESLSLDSGDHDPKETNQVGDLVSSLESGRPCVVFSNPTLEIGENRNEGLLERDPLGCSVTYGNMEGSQPEVADQMMVDNTCVSVSTRSVTSDAFQTSDSIPPKPEILPISSPLMIEGAMVEGPSEGSQPKVSDQMIASNTCISAIENSAGVIQPASLLEEAVTVSQPETDKTGIGEVPGTLESLQAKVADPADIGNACVSEPEKSVQPTSTSNQVIVESQTKGSEAEGGDQLATAITSVSEPEKLADMVQPAPILEAEGGDQLAIATTSVSEPEKLADMVQPAPILEERMDGKNQTELSESGEAEGGVQLSACASEPESRSVNLVPPASVLEEQMIESQIGSTETAEDERKNEMNMADQCASQSENTPGSLVHLTPASEEATEVQLKASATGETEIGVVMRVADACVSDREDESAKMFLPASSEEQMNGSQTGGSRTDKTSLTSVPGDHQHGSSAEKESCEGLPSHTDEEEPKVPAEDGDTCTIPENCEVVPTSLDDESGNMDLPAPHSTVQKQNLEELHPNISGETTQHDEENIPDDLVSSCSAAATEEKINALFEDNLELDPNGSGNEPGDHSHPMLGVEENDAEPSEESCCTTPVRS